MAETSIEIDIPNLLILIQRPTELPIIGNVIAVGISLFAALTIIELANSIGISSSRRKLDNLTSLVRKQKKNQHYDKVRMIELELQSAEVDLGGLHQLLMKISSIIILLSCIVLPLFFLGAGVYMSFEFAAVLMAFYMLGPAALFALSMAVSRKKLTRFQAEFDKLRDKLI